MGKSFRWRPWLRGLVSAGLLVWLVRWIDWAEFAQLAGRFRHQWGLLATLLFLGNHFLTSYKWKILLHAKGLVYRWSRLLRIVWVGNFLGHFLPTSLGGDNVRIVSIARSGGPAPIAISSVVMERISGMSTLGGLAVLGGVWSAYHWRRPELLLMIVLPAAIVVFGLLLVWSEPGYRMVRWISGRLHRFPGQKLFVEAHDALRSYDRAPGALALVFAISLFTQFLRVGIVLSVARGFGIEIPLLEATALVPTALFLSSLPISVGGWGVREGAFVLFLGLAGVGRDAAFGISLLSRAAALVSNLPGLWIFFREGLGGASPRRPGKEPDKERPLRVLCVIDKLGYEGRPHGPGRQCLTSLPRFDPGRCRIVPCVLRLDPRIDERFREAGIPLRDLRKSRFDPTTVRAIVSLIRREKIDLLHLSGLGSTCLGRIAAVLAGRPAIIHHHDSDERMPRIVSWIDYLLRSFTARAVAVSEEVAAFCARRRHVPPDRIVVIPNGIDLDRASRRPAEEAVRAVRERLGLREDEPVVGSVTRFESIKGVPTLLGALERLKGERAWRAVLVGDGPERAETEEEIARLGLSERVILAGYQPDLSPYWAIMDVAVFSSRSEGFPLALLEAMAAARPVVVTGNPGFLQIVRHEENGLVTPVDDPTAMAGAIDRLLRDRDLALRLGARSFLDVREYDVDHHVRRLENLYDEVALTSIPPDRSESAGVRTGPGDSSKVES